MCFFFFIIFIITKSGFLARSVEFSPRYRAQVGDLQLCKGIVVESSDEVGQKEKSSVAKGESAWKQSVYT